MAVDALRSDPDHAVLGDILEARAAPILGLDEIVVDARIREVARTLPDDASLLTRVALADILHDRKLDLEAAALLEHRVDLSRRGSASLLYLQCLAAARRDDALQTAIATASAEVREAPEVIWLQAIHAWNMGDLGTAQAAVGRLLEHQPQHVGAKLLRLEILIRQDRSDEVFATLDEPLELLPDARLKDRFRIAALLGHFGYFARAADLAYRLFLEHRDSPKAWMTLSGLVLREGREGQPEPRQWVTASIAENAAVDVEYSDGAKAFYVVEPDSALRKLDDESWEPNHPLIGAMIGLTTGAKFRAPDGREGIIKQIRHKYVARLHHVMEHYEERFPTVAGFRRVNIDTSHPDGLREIIAELKERHDWIRQEQEQYRDGPWPLGVYALHVGMDTIDAAGSLLAGGISLKVTNGNEAERVIATRMIRANGGKGCVLDLQTFWSAWCLKALRAIASICGPITLPQSVVDRLLERRDRFNESVAAGIKSGGYDNGKIAFREVPPEVVAGWRDDVEEALKWIGEHTTVLPLVAGESLPDGLRALLRSVQGDLFDSLIIAWQRGLLLVTDDLPTRQLGTQIGNTASTWLHQFINVAASDGAIDEDAYVRWSAYLIDAGHNYIGVTGFILSRALTLDAKLGDAPGPFFKALAKVIGGRGAEPRSHVTVVAHLVRIVWADKSAEAYRKAATGYVLRHLIRDRGDFAEILIALIRNLPEGHLAREYIVEWIKGNFLLPAVQAALSPPPSPRRESRAERRRKREKRPNR